MDRRKDEAKKITPWKRHVSNKLLQFFLTFFSFLSNYSEKDWQERQEKGQINYKSAGDLRKQLREIAPMNTVDSKIFCPNGPSAAVSPLMENKCGDRLAIPR